MKDTNISGQLAGKKIKVTPQRVAILKFLLGNTAHPSVNEVYRQVRKQFPSISKATVYNTVKTLAQAGLLKEILIQQEKTLVDANPGPHHHFKCLQCRKVKDVRYEILTAQEVNKLLQDHQVRAVQLTMEGICPDCRSALDRS